jgi:uncharacterized protein (TIGR03118 family)
MRTACLIGIVIILGLGASAQTNSYTVTPIVNNHQDSFLINPWGISRPVKPSLAENEWWTADTVTGVSTLYFADKRGQDSITPLVITIPSASGTTAGSPTGTAYNANAGPGPGVSNFTFATLDGTISNWNAGLTPPPGGSGCNACHVDTATIMVNNSSRAAVYFGLTVAKNATTQAPTYYATNFYGGVEAYDATTFVPVTLSGTFTDPRIPAGYAPYGIQAIGTRIWVTFYNGSSGGYVDAFDTNGNLTLRLARGSLSEPWGVVQAPANFGAFSNMLLVGNTTSGRIGAYHPTTGAFQGFLKNANGKIIVIPGLWGIAFGNGNTQSGPINTLYYSAGGSQYATGVFGAITAN